MHKLYPNERKYPQENALKKQFVTVIESAGSKIDKVTSR